MDKRYRGLQDGERERERERGVRQREMGRVGGRKRPIL